MFHHLMVLLPWPSAFCAGVGALTRPLVLKLWLSFLLLVHKSITTITKFRQIDFVSMCNFFPLDMTWTGLVLFLEQAL